MLLGRDSVSNRFLNGWWRWQQWLALPCSGPLLLAMMVTVVGDSYPLSCSLPHGGVFAAAVDGKEQVAPEATCSPLKQKENSGPYVDFELTPPLTDNREMVTLLQETKFPELSFVADVPLSSARHLPQGIGGLEGEARKKEFIGALLPTVMVAVNEVSQERQQLLAILAELGGQAAEDTFSEEQLAWQLQLGADKTRFVLSLVRKYGTASAKELVAMINVLPPSLILAQGALESGWGGSKYAVEANNLFGMYTSGRASQLNATDGLSAPRIREYDSILESVRAYVLNINRLPAYQELRRIRSHTLDPMQIAEGLTRYSERKEFYINDVKQIITLNKLQDYDALIPAAG